MPSNPSLWHMPLGDFRDAIESRSMPGCGAAAAAAAGIGLALILKGLRITDGKHSDPERVRLIEDADALLVRLGDYADEDVQAFEDYLAAQKQSGERHGRADSRDPALEAANERINRVPLDTARACLDALALADSALALTRASLHSDTLAGARLLHAGLTMVLLNVDANLANLQDARERDQLAQTRRELQWDADRKLDRLARLETNNSRS